MRGCHVFGTIRLDEEELRQNGDFKFLYFLRRKNENTIYFY